MSGHIDDPAFRERLEDTMETYAGTRAAAAEITRSLLTVGAGALAVKQVTPGVMSLGTSPCRRPHSERCCCLVPVGRERGKPLIRPLPGCRLPSPSWWHHWGLLALISVASAFAGIIADPVQKGLGLRQRRLQRLIDAVEKW